MKRIKLIDQTVATCSVVALVMTLMVVVAGALLTSGVVLADDSSVVSTAITVPVACSLNGIGMNSHTATLAPNTYSGASGSEYEDGIGKTTLTAICNDDNGFSIYAIGYTGDSYDSANHTKLVGSNTGGTIATKAYESTDTASNWSMKLIKVTDSTESYNPTNLTITTGYDAWHAIPDTFVKVAQYKANTGSSTTDMTLGVKLETTYAAFIAENQSADTYIGKVKYTMVHPYDEEPLQPQISNSGKISYYKNASNAEGTMGCQGINAAATSTFLLASNYSRQGYGFAGWSDKFDYATNPDAHFYGPQEDIAFTAGQYTSPNPGLSLYAVWIKSQGSLQDASKVATVCSGLTQTPTSGSANLSSVSALTDQRDNETYAIAKLADGNCWMIENLRLESTNSDNSAGALAQGYGASGTYGNFSGLATAETANFSNSTTANSLYYSGTQSGDATINIGTTDYPDYRMPRYNNWNHQASSANRPQNPTTNTDTNSTTNAGMYSYGNYYTWHAAIADLTYNAAPNQSIAGTSLCPRGWHLPTGGLAYAANNTGTVNVTGKPETFREFYNLSYIIMGSNITAYEDTPYSGLSYYGSNTTTANGDTATKAFRKYPNNFIYPGEFNGSSVGSRGSMGTYWSSTAYGDGSANSLYLNNSRVQPGTYNSNKSSGKSIRCLSSS